MKKLLLLAFCLLAFPAFGQTLASPGGGSSATFPTICPAPVASGQILYDNAGACGGITGWTTNGTTTITGAASTVLVVGGATPGTNALAVTGPSTLNESVGSSALTLTGATQTASFPALNITQTWNNAAVAFTAARINVTSTASNGQSLLIDLQSSSVSQLTVDRVGRLITIGSITSSSASGISNSSDTGGFFLGVSGDVILRRDAANTLAQRNGLNAQALRVYGSFTDVSNNTYGYMSQTAAANFTVGTLAAGTGTPSNLILQADVGKSVFLATQGYGTRWQMTSAGHLLTDTDNTYDIGADTATRPRTIFVGTSIKIQGASALMEVAAGGSYSFAARSRLFSGADGTIRLSNAAASDFNILQFGGTTSSFSALKRVTTTLGVRLADDSADAGITMSTIVASGITQITNATDSTTTTSGSLQVAGGAAIIKRVFIPGITSSSGLQTAVLCQSSGGEMIADSVACLASSARFKNLAGPMEDGALFKLATLPMRRWNYKPEGIFHNDVEHVGPIAEDVAAMDPRLAGYDKDGNVRTYSTEQLLAYTIKALQELKADNDNLRQEMKRVAR